MTLPKHSNNAKVSVLMAVRDASPVLFRKAVQSVLDQTLKEWELIIVEDPSPRCAGDVLKQFADLRIRYHRNAARTRLTAQRNLALSLATAPLVAFFDADDICTPSRLAKQSEYLAMHPDTGVVGSQVTLIDAHDETRGTYHFPLSHASIMARIIREIPVCQGSALYRKSLIEQIGAFRLTPQDTSEDYDLLSRLALHGVRFANLPEALLCYRFHDEQMKSARLHDLVRGVLHVKRTYWRDHMTLSGKMQMIAERALLWLPRYVAWTLLMRLKYQYRRGSRSRVNASTLDGAAQTGHPESFAPVCPVQSQANNHQSSPSYSAP